MQGKTKSRYAAAGAGFFDGMYLSPLFCALPVPMTTIRSLLDWFPFGGSEDLLLLLCTLIGITPRRQSLEAFRMEHVLSQQQYTRGINRRGPWGLTPLMLVTTRPEVVQLLLAARADPQLCDSTNRTFLGRVLSLVPGYLTVSTVKHLLRVCLTQAVPFRLRAGHTPSDNPQDTLNLLHPRLRKVGLVVHVLRETCVLRSGSVSMSCLARNAVIRHLDSLPIPVDQALEALGRVREAAEGEVTADVTSTMLDYLHYCDLLEELSKTGKSVQKTG